MVCILLTTTFPLYALLYLRSSSTYYLYNNRARVIFLSLGPESFAQNDGVFCNAMNAKAMDERTDVGRCPPLRDTFEVHNVVQQQQH